VNKFIFLIIFLVLFVNIIVNAPTAVLAKEPSVFNTEEIQKDPLKDPIAEADLIALGTITDKKYEIASVILNTDNITSGKFAYTIFTLSVEKVIKGNPDIKEVSIKNSGSPLDDRGIAMPSEAVFDVGDHVLAVLTHEEGTTYSFVQPGGIVWLNRGAVVLPGDATDLQYSLGRIVKIMLLKHIPITLPRSEWPPLPTSSPNVPPFPKGLPE
jgi:hypothetical protein